jgi:hypothetical protein
MDNRKKAELVFEEELAFIKNILIKEFVLECFDKLTPDYFWDGPASSTGKHHPKISNKKHGLVLHTKLCVWWGRKLHETLYAGETDLDICIAACLLHDLQKFGTTLNKDGSPTLPKYSSIHGILLAVQLEDIDSSMTCFCKIKDKTQSIIDAVAMHMGNWTNEKIRSKWFEGNDSLQEEMLIVHLADYCASKKVYEKMDKLDKWEFPEEAK